MNTKCQLEDCTSPVKRKGYCNKHVLRFEKHGDPNYSFFNLEQVALRLWSRVSVSADISRCWEWQGKLDDKGYGAMTSVVDGVKYRRAHRLSYRLFFGFDPGRMKVCHHCDNPPCVNPHHLFLGTQGTNMRDMAAKGRATKGSRQWLTKLTEQDIPEIRRALAAGVMQKDLAVRFGVSKGTIWHVSQGLTWAHVLEQGV